MSIFLLQFVIEDYASEVSKVSNVSEVSEFFTFLKKLGWTGGLPVYTKILIYENIMNV